MTRLELGRWEIEYDKEATAVAYQKICLVNRGCSCLSCENYYHAVPHFPSLVLDFFERVGIDARKPAEVYDCGMIKDNRVLYGGFYHIAGNYLSGDDVWQPVKKKRFFQRLRLSHMKPTHKIDEHFEIGFTNLVACVPDDFPRPVLQMEISFWTPWVLEEKFPVID